MKLLYSYKLEILIVIQQSNKHLVELGFQPRNNGAQVLLQPFYINLNNANSLIQHVATQDLNLDTMGDSFFRTVT